MDESQNSTTLKRFPWVEADLPGLLGCSREELTRLRQDMLTWGTDFILEKRRICLSTDALNRLLAALGLPLVVQPPEKIAVPSPDTVMALRMVPVAVVTFKVYPARTLNPHIILATDGKTLVRIRVKSKENFRGGMEVRCTHVQGDLYDLAGNCPRYPGKY